MDQNPFPHCAVFVGSATVRSSILGIVVATTAIAFLTRGNPAFAQTTPLPPGTTFPINPVPTIVTGTPPFGDTLLQEVSSPVFGTNGTNIISGSVRSAAFRNGSGFLDFFYQFAFDGSTNIIVDAISLSSFANVPGVSVGQTAEDVDGAGGLPAQNMGNAIQNNFTLASGTGSFSSASRPNVNGDSINAQFETGVTGGQTSFTFIVRTEATGFSLAGSASVQGGGISAFTVSQGAIAPLPASGVAAPEPSALALVGVSVFGFLAPLLRSARTQLSVRKL
jgi:hypothetical protein